MFFYKLIIEYKGTNYSGWQIQPKLKTIQGDINKAVETISKTSSVQSLAGGRTDAGVHALGQVVKVSTPLDIEVKAFLKGINSLTDNDIRVISVERVEETFNPIRDSLHKEYLYAFTNNSWQNCFQDSSLPNISYELDIIKMKEACELFVGVHDFKNFYCTGSPVNSTERKILECDLNFSSTTDLTGSIHPSHFIFRVKGEGFLKQMVRLMVGSLWEVGKGKMSLEDLRFALSQDLDHRSFPVAPPEGLYLHYFQF